VLIVLALAAIILLPEPWGLVALAAALALEALELVLWKRFLRRYRLRSGPETLIGAYATVVAECAPEGRVRIRGELWKARCSLAAAVGERCASRPSTGSRCGWSRKANPIWPRKRAPEEGPWLPKDVPPAMQPLARRSLSLRRFHRQQLTST
jgi:hypothetical protein